MSTAPRAVPEGRRVEVLRRLAIPDTLTDPAVLDLVDLVRELLGAERAAVTVVDHRRARTIVEIGDDGRSPPPSAADVARAASLADRLVRDPTTTLRFGVPADAADLTGHRWCVAVDPPGTVAAVPLVGVDGAVLGAFELAWAPDVEVPSAWSRSATRAAAQICTHLTARAERDEYRRFVELAPDAIAVLDLEGRLELVNPAMTELLAAEPGSLLGRSFLDLIVTADLPRVTGALARLLAGRESSTSIDTHLRRADGQRVPVAMSAGYLAGPHRSLQVVVRDLSGRIRAANERARLTEQLAQAHRFETVGQLASGLAHDLNNLLAVLLTNVELADETVDALAQGGPVEDAVGQLRDDLTALTEASQRVETLTRRLLAFAAERPQMVEVIGLAVRLEAIAHLLAPTLGDEVTLELEIEEGLPPLELDPVALERAVTNLVLNARDASAPGGEIRLVARSEPRAGGPTPHGGGRVVLEVRDQGQGMTEEIRNRAFEPLFTTRGQDRGTGLGLSTVLRFVEELGGDIHLDTAPGEGTCVSMSFPVPGPNPQDATDAADVVHGRIVLVEPAERSRGVIAAMLTAGGHRVEAVGGLDQIDDLQDGEVRAVVLAARDEDSPVAATAGDELAVDRDLVAAVRALAPQVPVVLLTSRHDQRPVGAAEVLRKPFLAERLLAAIDRVTAEGIDPTA